MKEMYFVVLVGMSLSNYAFYSFGAWEGEERSVLLNNEKGVILDARLSALGKYK